jgi:hypothetical protein
MPCPVIWVYVNAHWNTKLVFNPMPVNSGTVMSYCYPALLELAWYIWVTNSRYEYGAKFRWTQHCLPWKQELTPSCDLGSVYKTVYLYEWYLQNVLVYGRTWYIWIVVIISEYWDWNWTTCMETNEKILICLQAIEIHSDVTSSYALMRSYRRGLWWICNESKPLPAYTTMVISLRFSFKDFSQVFPMRDYGVYIEWCTIMMIFCPSIFPMGFLGLYFSVQSKTVSWALVSRIGLRGVFDGTVDVLVP